MILRFGPYTTVTTSFLRRHAVGTDRSTVAAGCHRVRPEFESLLDPLESGQVLEDQQGVTEQRGVGLGPLGFVSADVVRRRRIGVERVHDRVELTLDARLGCGRREVRVSR